MLTLRRARAPLNALRRGNATLQGVGADPTPTPELPKQADSKPEPAAASTPAHSTKGRNTPLRTRRAFITLDRPREWSRPLAPGVLPAYDEALWLLRKDSAAIKKEAEELAERLKKLEGVSQEERTELEKRLDILRVQGEVNMPEVRWKARNGMADLKQPVYRHLAEQRWRGEGGLDLLMERIHQMHVVPDVLSSLHPSFDMRITFPMVPPDIATKTQNFKVKHHLVEPGVFLSPKQTRRPPRIYTTVFHTDPRYYTLIMLDPDYPDPSTERYKTYLHWLQPNIQLSASASGLLSFASHTPYIPPHPQNGSSYHRYVLLLLPHRVPNEKLDIPVPSMEAREDFNSREFVETYELDGSKGGAAHMWREVWDEEVSKIYKTVLKCDEPRYGHISSKALSEVEYKYVGHGNKFAGQGDRRLAT